MKTTKHTNNVKGFCFSYLKSSQLSQLSSIIHRGWLKVKTGAIISSFFAWCLTNLSVKNIQVISVGLNQWLRVIRQLTFQDILLYLHQSYNQTNLDKDYPRSEDNAKCDRIRALKKIHYTADFLLMVSILLLTIQWILVGRMVSPRLSPCIFCLLIGAIPWTVVPGVVDTTIPIPCKVPVPSKVQTLS